MRLECTFGGQKVGFKHFEPCSGFWYWGAYFLDWDLVCFYCGYAAVKTNLGQSSLGSGLLCWGWRQNILEVQIVQQLGVLIGQLGAQNLDLGLDLGVFFQAALEELVGQVQLCLYASGGEVVGVSQAVVRVPEVLQLDVALVDEAGQTIIDAAQGHTHVSAELPLGPAEVLGQEAE